MATIALKTKYLTGNLKRESIFKQIAAAYRENQAEAVCGMLGICGDTAAAVRMYQMLKK